MGKSFAKRERVCRSQVNRERQNAGGVLVKQIMAQVVKVIPMKFDIISLSGEIIAKLKRNTNEIKRNNS